VKYDLENKLEQHKIIQRLEWLIDKQAKVELKEVRKPRTIKQNAYLHVCISLFAIECGYTLDEAKTLLKRQCQFMRYEKNDNLFLRRTREMDTKELTEFVEWIRNYASLEVGLYIPTSEEYLQNKWDIDHGIERNAQYL